MPSRPFYLAGAFKRGDETLKVTNPYNGETAGEVSLASREDIDLAIERGVEAFRTTRAMPSYERANVLTQIAAQLNLRAEEFAKTITLENGKPIQASRKEVGRAAATFWWAAEEAKRIGENFFLWIY